MLKIDYPKEQSEVEILAELQSNLQRIGIDFRLDVLTPGRSHCRLDGVVFISDRAVCIVECKASPINLLSSQYKKRLQDQVEKYQNLFGLPILTCGNSKIDIARTIQTIKGIVGNE